MPRKSLQGCTCGVSCDGGRARAPQPNLALATDRMRRNPDAASCLLVTAHTDHLDWSLPAHRRGTLRGMDAA
ncbi:hypothetical protein XarbCFBP6827_12390 [Xanthomonas arboricola]|nr:hypothetical protein XarbCFBP6827_12390 [Xanthomonas arboricola]